MYVGYIVDRYIFDLVDKYDFQFHWQPLDVSKEIGNLQNSKTTRAPHVKSLIVTWVLFI